MNERSCLSLADVPPAPTVDNPTCTALDVTPGWGSNPVRTELAIHDETRGCWIQDDGSCGNEEFWKDYHWSTVPISGLNPGTSYEFKIKARNFNNIETALGAAGFGTTSDCPLLPDGMWTIIVDGFAETDPSAIDSTWIRIAEHIVGLDPRGPAGVQVHTMNSETFNLTPNEASPQTDEACWASGAVVGPVGFRAYHGLGRGSLDRSRSVAENGR